jgi:hypothetical protein
MARASTSHGRTIIITLNVHFNVSKKVNRKKLRETIELMNSIEKSESNSKLDIQYIYRFGCRLSTETWRLWFRTRHDYSLWFIVCCSFTWHVYLSSRTVQISTTRTFANRNVHGRLIEYNSSEATGLFVCNTYTYQRYCSKMMKRQYRCYCWFILDMALSIYVMVDWLTDDDSVGHGRYCYSLLDTILHVIFIVNRLVFIWSKSWTITKNVSLTKTR